MITQDQINDIVDIIVKNVGPEKVILFGSYAYGQPLLLYTQRQR